MGNFAVRRNKIFVKIYRVHNALVLYNEGVQKITRIEYVLKSLEKQAIGRRY